jgi:hypothetical protein
MFVGFVALGGTITVSMLEKNSSGAPVNADSLPSYRVYGPAGLMQNGTGAVAFKDSKAITAASNAAPIKITSVGHGLTAGSRVTIAGVLGNTAANGTWTITPVDADNFTLGGSSGNGAYTSGGTWNVVGLYQANINAVAADGYDAGDNYTVLFMSSVAGAAASELKSFAVV